MLPSHTDPSQSRIHIIACGVLASDLRHVARQLSVPVSLECLPGGLHTDPEMLGQQLQQRIDLASATFRGDRIVVGYGVCGRGTVGLHAHNVPLVIPRVNDCIALFLGSDDAYRDQFARHPGTYYISAGWVEEKAQPQESDASIQCGPDCFTLQQLVDRYGQDNADAIESFLNSWQRNYKRAAYIETGVGAKRHKYADLAQAMAKQFGWAYEEIQGSHDLLNKLLTTSQSSNEILLVPPHHVTVHDPVRRTLTAVPVWETDHLAAHDHTLTFEAEQREPLAGAGEVVRLGLGIDAGGTYTDVVLYDVQRDEVVEKAKALTTKWDYTLGISEALDRLSPKSLSQVDLVSISTTLATNAIVEGRGQKVGLLIFPPYGLFQPSHIPYRPIGILQGQLEIDGRELQPIDPAQVCSEIRRMVTGERVGAFAVSGYASHVNPDHELRVKQIIEEETGLWVSCAHELSEKCNYRIRSVTAALNASIIPYLDSFLCDADHILKQRGITAPRMVVKSDGTLMSLSMAHGQPILTILSGPAASVAGASYLAGVDNAMVVDMGGTTTDTATLRRGCVRACREGAHVGNWRTHVEALDMRTLGLGGDSLIARQRAGKLQIGPRRVAPVSWLFRDANTDTTALDWLEANLDRYRRSTKGMEFVAATNDGAAAAALTEQQRRILDHLQRRPSSVDELTEQLNLSYRPTAQIESLEENHLIVTSSLTPTDVAHTSRHVELWNAAAAERVCRLFCRLMDASMEQLIRTVHQHLVGRVAVELLRSHLGDATEADGWDGAAANALVDNWLAGGNDDFRVHIGLRYPIIGIGAPIHLYLPDVARLLETDAVIPSHADVANAIGAITARVSIHRQVEIEPTENGKYRVSGLSGTPSFDDFETAHRYAIDQLLPAVREQAVAAGTSDSRVEVIVHDRVAPSGYGGHLFVGRTLTAQLVGRPDIARLTRQDLSYDQRS